MGEGKHIAAGTKVSVAEPMDVPRWSEFDDDKGRTSVPTKRRMQLLFFRGDKKVTAEVVYIGNEKRAREAATAGPREGARARGVGLDGDLHGSGRRAEQDRLIARNRTCRRIARL